VGLEGLEEALLEGQSQVELEGLVEGLNIISIIAYMFEIK
jgi:hypothetical protein